MVDVPESRIDSAGIWLTGSSSSLDKPGAASTPLCPIVVPFDHILRKAIMACNEIEKAGTLTVDLVEADDGDAESGTSIDQLVNATLVDSSDKVAVHEFTIATADKGSRDANKLYWLSAVGTNAADLLHQPCLSICVEPISRSTL